MLALERIRSLFNYPAVIFFSFFSFFLLIPEAVTQETNFGRGENRANFDFFSDIATVRSQWLQTRTATWQVSKAGFEPATSYICALSLAR